MAYNQQYPDWYQRQMGSAQQRVFDPYGNPQDGYGQPDWEAGAGGQEQIQREGGQNLGVNTTPTGGGGQANPSQPVTPGLDQGQIQPGPQPNQLFPQFQGFQFFQPGQIPQLSLPGYEAMQFSSANLPTFDQEDALIRQQVMQMLQNPTPNPAQSYANEEAMTRDLIQKILSSPQGLSDIQVAQLKERNKEEALGYENQILNQTQQNAASRGTLYGGNLAAQERKLKEGTAQSVLKGNRDVDIQAAGRRFGDQMSALSGVSNALGQAYDRAGQGQNTQLNALSGANAALAGIMGRSLQPAQFNLQREMAQAGENQFGANLAMQGQSLALQRALGEGNLNMGADQLFESARQNDNNLGFNYAQLQELAYQNWLRSMGIGG